jgi:hypothetical protein
MNDRQPKAVRQGYKPAPFFFHQSNERGDVRIAAWAPSLGTMQSLFERLIGLLPPSIEVLVKVKAEEDQFPGDDPPSWCRFHGVVARDALLEAIARCPVFVFEDSRNQLCLRDPRSFDYIVLDDVGVVSVYSGQPPFRHVLAEFGFEERVEPLVNDEWFWCQTPKAGPDQERDFIRLLRLEPVPGPGEGRDRSVIH